MRVNTRGWDVLLLHSTRIAATHWRGVPQTYNNVLHVYGLHWAKEHALPLGGALEGSAAALRRCDLYLQHSVALEQARQPATALAEPAHALQT